MGRPWDLLDANIWALKHMDHKVLGTMEQGAHLIGPVTVAESARIRSGAYIEGPVFIDEEADIGPNCYIRLRHKSWQKNSCGQRLRDQKQYHHGWHPCRAPIICWRQYSWAKNAILGAGTIMANFVLTDGHIKMMVKDRVVDTGDENLVQSSATMSKQASNHYLCRVLKSG